VSDAQIHKQAKRGSSRFGDIALAVRSDKAARAGHDDINVPPRRSSLQKIPLCVYNPVIYKEHVQSRQSDCNKLAITQQ